MSAVEERFRAEGMESWEAVGSIEERSFALLRMTEIYARRKRVVGSVLGWRAEEELKVELFFEEVGAAFRVLEILCGITPSLNLEGDTSLLEGSV